MLLRRAGVGRDAPYDEQDVDNSRLLDDLGSDRLDPRETYLLTVPAEVLEPSVRRLHGLAAAHSRVGRISCARAAITMVPPSRLGEGYPAVVKASPNRRKVMSSPCA